MQRDEIGARAHRAARAVPLAARRPRAVVHAPAQAAPRRVDRRVEQELVAAHEPHTLGRVGVVVVVRPVLLAVARDGLVPRELGRRLDEVADRRRVVEHRAVLVDRPAAREAVRLGPVRAVVEREPRAAERRPDVVEAARADRVAAAEAHRLLELLVARLADRGLVRDRGVREPARVGHAREVGERHVDDLELERPHDRRHRADAAEDEAAVAERGEREADPRRERRRVERAARRAAKVEAREPRDAADDGRARDEPDLRRGGERARRA